MADEFSFLSDSDNERAVQDVLSQAMDHSVLEQLAAINCSSFSNSDNLPSHLETRFRKLKSLPTTAAARGSPVPPSKSKSLRPRSGDDSDVNESHREFCNPVDFKQIPEMKEKSSPSIESTEEDSDGNRDVKKGTKSKSNRNLTSELNIQKPKTGTGSSKSRTDSSILSSPESESGACRRRSLDEDSDGTRDEKNGTKSKPKSSSNTNSNSDFCKQKDLKSISKSKTKSGTRSYKSRSDSWTLSSSESESRTLSPPWRSIGCLWCSPKKEKSVSRKQGKENRLSPSSSSWGNEYEYDVEFLKTFSMKEQKKIMKKAMKEEEKINREAEKIVKWAKQASSRMMDVSGLHDELTDFENTKR